LLGELATLKSKAIHGFGTGSENPKSANEVPEISGRRKILILIARLRAQTQLASNAHSISFPTRECGSDT
jgi:hypothetical protein